VTRDERRERAGVTSAGRGDAYSRSGRGAGSDGRLGLRVRRGRGEHERKRRGRERRVREWLGKRRYGASAIAQA